MKEENMEDHSSEVISQWSFKNSPRSLIFLSKSTVTATTPSQAFRGPRPIHFTKRRKSQLPAAEMKASRDGTLLNINDTLLFHRVNPPPRSILLMFRLRPEASAVCCSEMFGP